MSPYARATLLAGLVAWAVIATVLAMAIKSPRAETRTVIVTSPLENGVFGYGDTIDSTDGVYVLAHPLVATEPGVWERSAQSVNADDLCLYELGSRVEVVLVDLPARADVPAATFVYAIRCQS